MSASIELAKADITALSVDAIVNAANEALQLGAGVAGAIRLRGGPKIQEECDAIGHCATGEAVVTGAGNLRMRWIIHAVGPVWRGGESGEEVQLASAILAALARAEEVGAKSVALPAISTGIYGFPLSKAASISIAAARSFAAKAKTVERILFALHDDRALAVFEKALVESQ
jgi:O-acetyl-ADP-ribose deacetylase (regulator of RNase III)